MEISISFIHLTRPLCASLDSDSDTDLKKEFVELFQGFLIFQVYMKWIVVKLITNPAHTCAIFVTSVGSARNIKRDSCITIVRITDSICCLLATGEYSFSVCWLLGSSGLLTLSGKQVSYFQPELYFKMFACRIISLIFKTNLLSKAIFILFNYCSNSPLRQVNW